MSSSSDDPSAEPADDLSDFDLLEAWAAGDKNAGAILFERHVASLQRFFDSRLPHAADDLVQSTLLACIEGRDRMRQRSSFRAYLLGIARNQLYTQYRRHGTERRKQTFNTTSRYYLGASPSAALSRDDDDARLIAAMQMLPTQMQLLLQLAYWEDLTPVELAEVFEIPVSAVHSRLHRAKQRLREVLASLEASVARPSAD